MRMCYTERMDNESEIEKLARMVENGFTDMRGHFDNWNPERSGWKAA